MSRIAAVLFTVIFITACQSLPSGNSGEKAEVLKEKMKEAAAVDNFKNTAAVSFLFADRDRIFWDRQSGFYRVEWSSWGDDYRVERDRRSGAARIFENGEKVTDHEERKELYKEAEKKFVNDTYWLIPQVHFDSPGAQSYYIDDKTLRITFSSGGVTPGDSYVFHLNDENLIKTMEMWVDIIPFSGVDAGFSEYKKTETGVPVAREHSLLLFVSVDLTDMKMYAEYPLEGEADVFKELRARRNQP